MQHVTFVTFGITFHVCMSVSVCFPFPSFPQSPLVPSERTNNIMLLLYHGFAVGMAFAS